MVALIELERRWGEREMEIEGDGGEGSSLVLGCFAWLID